MVISSFSLKKAEKYNTGHYWTCWTTIYHRHSVYIISLSFKLNDFIAYFETMIRVLVMFTCLLRHHHNKAPPLHSVRNGHILGEEQPWTLQTDLEALGHRWWISCGECTQHNQIKDKWPWQGWKNEGDSKGYISEQTSSKQLSKILAAKNYSMFSQKHINNLKLRCAKLLAVCFPT